MAGVLLIVAITLLVLLIAVTSISPNVASVSAYEVLRRKKAGDATIRTDYLRDELFQDVISIQRVLQAVLLVLFVLASVGAFGWLVGTLAAVLVALWFGAIARVPFIAPVSQRLYDRYERLILEYLERHINIVKWVRTVMPAAKEARLASKEELRHLVMDAQHVLSRDEQALITSSLNFPDKQVRDIMTPKSVVDTIKSSEILGPLVLDDLHKTGHSRFPVINGDIDHVVGILYLRDVLTIDTRKQYTARAESAMSSRVYYIRDDHSLEQALNAFIKTHHHLFIVINEFRETVGIITIEDTLEALLGRKIVDEFDAHDDMRAVAARQAGSRQSINRSPDARDV